MTDHYLGKLRKTFLNQPLLSMINEALRKRHGFEYKCGVVTSFKFDLTVALEER